MADEYCAETNWVGSLAMVCSRPITDEGCCPWHGKAARRLPIKPDPAIAAAESRGRTAGYAEAVQALRPEKREQFAHWWAHVRDPEKPIPGGWTDLAADYLEYLAVAPSATTEEPTP